MGLIPLHEPDEAVAELRRIVEELHFAGAMLPGTGASQLQNHLGDERYWPIYEEADRLGCALGIHGGVHDNMGLDDMSPYAPVNALGHPFGQMVNFAGIVFNGVFDRYPNARFGFLEAGAAWFVNCLDASSAPEQPRPVGTQRGFLQLKDNESVPDYAQHWTRADLRGLEGDEADPALRRAPRGQQAVPLLVDFPHEVNHATAKEEIPEFGEPGSRTTTRRRSCTPTPGVSTS